MAETTSEAALNEGEGTGLAALWRRQSAGSTTRSNWWRDLHGSSCRLFPLGKVGGRLAGSVVQRESCWGGRGLEQVRLCHRAEAAGSGPRDGRSEHYGGGCGGRKEAKLEGRQVWRLDVRERGDWEIVWRSSRTVVEWRGVEAGGWRLVVLGGGERGVRVASPRGIDEKIT